MDKFTIGTDPEFFLVDRNTGKMVSAIPHIEGTKEEPKELPCGAGLQRDNVALEFASTPADTVQDFVTSISDAFKDIMIVVPKNLEMVAIPSANFEKDQLNDPEALRFGCDTDYDAWKLEANPAAYCNDPTFRSCGGHIHLGHIEGGLYAFLLNPWGKIMTVRTMDAVHGISSVVLDGSKNAIKRRRLYGKAGCHRPTDYGVEYRVLSNFWLKSPELVSLIWSLSKDVLNMVEAELAEDFTKKIGENEIQEIINKGKAKEAMKVLEKEIRPVLSGESLELLDVCLNKVEGYDFKQEWKLTVGD